MSLRFFIKTPLGVREIVRCGRRICLCYEEFDLYKYRALKQEALVEDYAEYLKCNSKRFVETTKEA